VIFAANTANQAQEIVNNPEKYPNNRLAQAALKKQAGKIGVVLGVGISVSSFKLQSTSEASNQSEALQEEVSQLERANKTYEKRIIEHEKKLEDYKNDPHKYDNKKLLEGKSKEMQEIIINGRIGRLQRELRKFFNLIKNNNEKIKNIQKQIQKTNGQ
jgi:hypothetical protein